MSAVSGNEACGPTSERVGCDGSACVPRDELLSFIVAHSLDLVAAAESLEQVVLDVTTPPKVVEGMTLRAARLAGQRSLLTTLTIRFFPTGDVPTPASDQA